MGRIKVFICIVLIAVTSICFQTVASACTAVYVGKDVSENGTTMIARSVEWIPGYMSYVDSYDAQKHKAGDFIKDNMSGFEYEYPEQTYKYILASSMDFAEDGKTSDACINEYGLAVSATVTAYANEKALKADPYVEDGISEGSISLILGSCCKSAREAVELICDIVDEYGSADANIILIADQEEAWYVELYTGHQYAAVKMPEDKAAVVSNQFMLGSFDTKKQDIYYSKDIINLAKKNKFAVFEKDGCINLFKTYASGVNDFIYPRIWKTQQLLSPEKSSKYDPDKEYQLFFEPDDKVSFADVAEIFRTEYDEDDEFDLEDDKMIIPIHMTTVNSMHIIEIYDNLPAEMSNVLWFCNSPAKYGQFVPISNIVDEIPESYSTNLSTREYVKSVAACEFSRLNGICIVNPDYIGERVVTYNTAMENANKYAFDKHIKEWKSNYKKNSSEVKKAITQYCALVMEESVDDAQRLFEEVSWNLGKQPYPYYIINDKKAYCMDFNPTETFELCFDFERMADKYDWTVKRNDKSLAATKDGRSIVIDLSDDELYMNEQIDWKTGEVLFTEDKKKILNSDGSVASLYNIEVSDENSDEVKRYATYINEEDGKIMTFVNVLSLLGFTDGHKITP